MMARWVPGSECVCVCLSVSLSVSACVFVYLYVGVPLCVYVCLCLHAYVCDTKLPTWVQPLEPLEPSYSGQHRPLSIEHVVNPLPDVTTLTAHIPVVTCAV